MIENESPVVVKKSNEVYEVNVGGEKLFMFEMSINRQEAFVQLWEDAYKSMNIKKETEILDIFKKLPKKQIAKIFNFICFPKACLGCKGHKKNSCNNPKLCVTEKKKIVKDEWIGELVNREIMEIFKGALRQNQLEKAWDFFLGLMKDKVNLILKTK